MKKLLEDIQNEISKVEELIDFLEINLDEKDEEEKSNILKEISSLL